MPIEPKQPKIQRLFNHKKIWQNLPDGSGDALIPKQRLGLRESIRSVRFALLPRSKRFCLLPCGQMGKIPRVSHAIPPLGGMAATAWGFLAFHSSTNKEREQT